MAVWLALAGLVVALGAAIALSLALRSSRQRAARSAARLADAESTIRAVVEQEATTQAEELRRLLQRTRADSLSALAEEERRIAEERRRDVTER